jgi:hypothetical protein
MRCLPHHHLPRVRWPVAQKDKAQYRCPALSTRQHHVRVGGGRLHQQTVRAGNARVQANAPSEPSHVLLVLPDLAPVVVPGRFGVISPSLYFTTALGSG